ncbi:MAG TPA: putative lipid II flippase FtsW [Burkholderiales bacterium]|jgi:cell division protein FtsW|nr:putative lipid II flippase FtsW [Burkholderiales bacterium]
MNGVLGHVANRPAPIAELDYAVVSLAALLLGIGLVMVYSSSIAIAEAGNYTGNQPAYFLIRHSVFVFVGVMAGFICFQFPTRLWQQAAPYLFLLGVLLLLVVLIPGIGKEVNGSQRWLSLGLFNLQPSELMKLLVMLYAADYTVRKAALMHSFRKGFLPMLMVMLLVGGLLLREPDFGAFVVVTVIAMGVLFLGGMNWKLFAALIMLLIIGFVLLIWSSPYRLQRVLGFMDPWSDPFGKGYQLSHALIAFGRGEWFGVGLGASVEKLFYLPEAHTDFLLAVIAEELGFAGVIAVVALFAWLTWRAFAIGNQAARLERYFSALVAQGVGLWIGAQAAINMGVNMGVLPTKGLTLPLLSFGGSGIVANCCALAILLRVDYENRQMMKGLSL